MGRGIKFFGRGLSQLQACKKTCRRTPTFPGEMGETIVEKTARLGGEISGGLGRLVQSLFVNMGHAIIFANKEQDHGATADEKGNLEHFLGKVANSQAYQKRSTHVWQEKGGGKDVDWSRFGYGLIHDVLE